MKELIEKIIEHKNKNDRKIIFSVMEFIKKYEVQSEEQLKVLEDKNYTLLDINGNVKLSDEEIVNNLYHEYDEDYDDYTACSLEERTKLDKLNEEYLSASDIDTKFIILIKMYSILDWDLVLPYHAYKYILGDKML